MPLFNDRRRSSVTYSTQNEKVNRNAVAAAHTIGKLFQGPTGSTVNSSQVSLSRQNSMRFNKTGRSYNDQLRSMMNESEIIEPDYSGFASFSDTVSISSASPNNNHVASTNPSKPKQKRPKKVASTSNSSTPLKQGSNSTARKSHMNSSSNSTPAYNPYQQTKTKIIRKVVPTAYGLRTIEVSAADDAREYQQTISRTSSMTSSITTPSKNHRLRKHSSFTSASSSSPMTGGYQHPHHHDFKSFDNLVLEEDASANNTLLPPSALSQRSSLNVTSTPQKNRQKRVSFNELSVSPGAYSLINNSIIEEDDDSAIVTELTPRANNYNYASPLKFKNNNNSSSSLKLKRNTVLGPISSNTSSKVKTAAKKEQRIQTTSIVHKAESLQDKNEVPKENDEQQGFPVDIIVENVEVVELVNQGPTKKEEAIKEQNKEVMNTNGQIDDQVIQPPSEPLEPPSQPLEASTIKDLVKPDPAAITEISTTSPSTAAGKLAEASVTSPSPATTKLAEAPVTSPIPATTKLAEASVTSPTPALTKLAEAPKITHPSKTSFAQKTNTIARKPSQRQSTSTTKPSSANRRSLPPTASKPSKRHSMIERSTSSASNSKNLPPEAAAAASIKKSYAAKNNSIPPRNKVRPVSMLTPPVSSSISTPKKNGYQQQAKPKPLFNGTGIQRSVSTSRSSFRNNMDTLESPAALHTKSSFEKLSNSTNSNNTNNSNIFKRHSMRDFSTAGATSGNGVSATGASNGNGSGYTSPISMMKSRFADSDDEDEGYGTNMNARTGGFNRLSLRGNGNNNATIVNSEPSRSQPESRTPLFGFNKLHHQNNIQNNVTSIAEEPDVLKTPSTINSDKLFEKHLSESKQGFFKSQFNNSYSNYHKQKKEAKLKKNPIHEGIDNVLLGGHDDDVIESAPKKNRFSKIKKMFGKK